MDNPNDIEEWIRYENSGDCVDDQVQMAYWFWENEVIEPEDRWKRTTEVGEALEDTLNHGPRTVIENLNEIGVLELNPGGETKYIRKHRTEDNYWTPEEDGFVDAITDEITRFLLDMRDQERVRHGALADGGSNDDSRSIREIAAEALEVAPDEVVSELTGTLEFIEEVPEPAKEGQLILDDPVERMNRYDTASSAVIDHEDVERGRNYEPMGFRNQSNRYTISETAVAVERNKSLSDF